MTDKAEDQKFHTYIEQRKAESDDPDAWDLATSLLHALTNTKNELEDAIFNYKSGPRLKQRVHEIHRRLVLVTRDLAPAIVADDEENT
jgi:uridine kinase